MLLLTGTILGLLTQALAQITAAPSAAPSAAATAVADCVTNADLLSCVPQTTICITSNSVDASCVCSNAPAVVRCYSSYCASMLPAISAASSIACSVANTLDLPTGIVTSTSAAKTSTATPGTGTGAGMASTATGTSAASTSKAGAERGTDHAMPVLGGLLGAFIGAVGIFL